MNHKPGTLTLEEKIGLIHGAGLFQTKGVPRLNILPLKMSDGPMGVRNDFENEVWQPLKNNDDYVTYLPSISALASTWNPSLAFLSGDVLGREARGRGKDIILGPGVNLKRTPLGGRNFEYFSEDPFLTIEMAVPFIKGVQQNDVAACLKHFAVNNQETHRMDLEVVLDEETLEKVYLRVFKEIIEKAQPYSLMGSYSKLHGEFCCESNYLLEQTLRKKWGYEGVVISDWGGVHDTKKAALHGVDIEMSVTANFDDYFLAEPLKKAIAAGEVPEEKIDEKVARILHLMKKIKLGAEERKAGGYNVPSHRQAAEKVAEESIVLLKNEANRLPLKKTGSILVIGENAVYQHAGGGGSAEIKALYEISPLMGLKMQLGGKQAVDYIPGYQSVKKLTADDAHPDATDLNWQADSLKDQGIINHGVLSAEEKKQAEILRQAAVKKAMDYDTVIFIGGLNHDFDVENQDRATMHLPYEQEKLIGDLLKVKPETVVVLCGGSPVDLTSFLSAAKTLVYMYYAGMEGGIALAKVLLGKVNPSGHLAETFPLSYDTTPVARFGEFPGGKTVTYNEGPYLGYRYYETFGQDVAFPFGYGLSYTEFSYEDFSFASKTGLITGKVRNKGKLAGKTVVQVYKVKKELPTSSTRPKKELIQFAKVYVEAGAVQEVTLQLDPKLLADKNFDQLCIGTSVKDFFYETNLVTGEKYE